MRGRSRPKDRPKNQTDALPLGSAILGMLFLLAANPPALATEIPARKTPKKSDSLSFDQQAVGVAPTKDQNPIPRTQDAAPDLKAQRLIPMAFGSDGFPKIRKFYRNQNNSKLLERVENDFNGDGKLDFVQWYDPTGQFVEREAADIDGNGRMNVTSHYKMIIGQNKRDLVLQEFDAKFEGKTSVWKHFKEGKLVRREIDRRGFGRPDYWEFYEDSKLIKIEKDENSDGIPDSQPIFKTVIKPQSPEPVKTKPPAQVR